MNLVRNLKTKKFIWITTLAIAFTCITLLTVICLSALKPNRATAETVDELLYQVSQAEQLYDKALSEQYAAEAKYNECEEKIAYAEENIPKLQKQIGQRLKEIYMEGTNNLLFLLLDSDSLSDVLIVLDYANKINQQDTELVSTYTDLKLEAKAAEEQIRPSLDAAKESANEAASILAGVQDAINALQAQNVPVVPGGGGDDPTPTPDPPGPTPPGPTPPGPIPPGPIPSGDDIISRAKSCIGLPYGWGCAGPYAFDCSGLVSFAYSGEFVHYYSTYTIRDEAGNGINGWWRTDNPTNGTCCCSITHCGIYYDGMMIHAPQPGEFVKIGEIQNNMLFYNR